MPDRTKPFVYLYSTTVDPQADVDDIGWWFQCYPCPALEVGGEDQGPYATASDANHGARLHITTTHQTQE